MALIISKPVNWIRPRLKKQGFYVLLVVAVVTLAVVQDYIFSQVKHTGFYLSESLLYNTFWIFFIPFSLLLYQGYKKLGSSSWGLRLVALVSAGVGLSLIHLLIFTAFFVWVSSMIYTPSHRFSAIFSTALSQQWYIAILWYTLFPLVYGASKKTSQKPKFASHITTKQGKQSLKIATSAISHLMTDKPYSVIYIGEQKYLDNRSLKEFEALLDSEIFIRVHRSAILNSNMVCSLHSRSNGDYDAVLATGVHVRLSRHYRKNWNRLLH